MVEKSTQISEADRFHVSTQHPLSRFRLSLGSATNVRTLAGGLIAGAAISPDECFAVGEFALDWMRSDEPTLQGAGAAILTLPNLSSGTARSSELAKHSNPKVRQAAVQMSTVGAPITDLAIFREMISAWYAWHFDQDRGSYANDGEWLENVRTELWKLYPDLSVTKGVAKAIMELIDADLRAMRAVRENEGTMGINVDSRGQNMINILLRDMGAINGRIVDEAVDEA